MMIYDDITSGTLFFCDSFFLKLRVVARVQRNPKRPGGDAAAAPAAGPPKKWDAKKRRKKRGKLIEVMRFDSIPSKSRLKTYEDIRRHETP